MEVTIAHWFIQSIFVLVQMALGFLLVILVYGVHCRGSLSLAIFVAFLEGLSGLSLGTELFFKICIFIIIICISLIFKWK